MISDPLDLSPLGTCDSVRLERLLARLAADQDDDTRLRAVSRYAPGDVWSAIDAAGNRAVPIALLAAGFVCWLLSSASPPTLEPRYVPSIAGVLSSGQPALARAVLDGAARGTKPSASDLLTSEITP